MSESIRACLNWALGRSPLSLCPDPYPSSARADIGWQSTPWPRCFLGAQEMWMYSQMSFDKVHLGTNNQLDISLCFGSPSFKKKLWCFQCLFVVCSNVLNVQRVMFNETTKETSPQDDCMCNANSLRIDSHTELQKFLEHQRNQECNRFLEHAQVVFLAGASVLKPVFRVDVISWLCRCSGCRITSAFAFLSMLSILQPVTVVSTNFKSFAALLWRGGVPVGGGRGWHLYLCPAMGEGGCQDSNLGWNTHTRTFEAQRSN